MVGFVFLLMALGTFMPVLCVVALPVLIKIVSVRELFGVNELCCSADITGELLLSARILGRLDDGYPVVPAVIGFIGYVAAGFTFVPVLCAVRLPFVAVIMFVCSQRNKFISVKIMIVVPLLDIHFCR